MSEPMNSLSDFQDETELVRKFRTWNQANLKVFEMFESFGLEAIKAGRHKFGAAMIWERLRWYTQIETRGDSKFKLANYWKAFYARKFEQRHEDHAGLFVKRASMADKAIKPL